MSFTLACRSMSSWTVMLSVSRMQLQVLSGVLLAESCISWPSQQAASCYYGGMVLQQHLCCVPSASVTGNWIM